VLLAAIVAVAVSASPATSASRADRARVSAKPARHSEAPRADAARSADAAPSANARPGARSRAPSRPPLTGAAGPILSAGPGGDEAAQGGSPQAEADPLVSNGLGSPLCKAGVAAAQLTERDRANCQTSGFVASGAPTGNFGLDVHIDTGVLGLSSGGLLTAVQDLFVTPVWMAIVWAVHALVVMLEWCFTIDLLDSGSVSSGLSRGLRQMQASFTYPWLGAVFAVGGVLAAYNGLVRRRIAETLGQALLALAMTAAGLWVMLDPVGTVGQLGAWANGASLGTLAIAARGSPTDAPSALAAEMGTVFSAVVEVPWCYLEFGDVGWCRNPRRLDGRLHKAALALATSESAAAGCNPKQSAPPCSALGSSETRALAHSARLLRAARTNGAIFLALPANGPERNAINQGSSLLHAICESDDATACRGPAAAQAEFRTNHGTWARVAGLLLIVAGSLGMLLLLGFVAIRLLTSALFSLLYLLLAPAAVLAPMLGDGGRALFRRWAAQLLGAVVSKLLFSFLLGAILAILGILAGLEALGWWTQWLLMSAFWWAAFTRRHQALHAAGGAIGRDRGDYARRSLARRVSEALDPPRKLIGDARSAKERLSKRAPEIAGERSTERTSLVGRGAVPREQAERTLVADYRAARAHARQAPRIEQRVGELRSRLERVNAERDRALASGDDRRAARLGHRARRIETGIEREQRDLETAHHVLNGGEHAPGGSVFSPAQAERRNRFLDQQAALPSGNRRAERGAHGGTPGPGATGERRDYVALAGLAGYAGRQYERLAPREQRSARAEIDKELALRRERLRFGMPRAVERPSDASPSRTPRVAEQPLRIWRAEQAPNRPDAALESESSVMRDAREVAARRKRQLGHGRP